MSASYYIYMPCREDHTDSDDPLFLKSECDVFGKPSDSWYESPHQATVFASPEDAIMHLHTNFPELYHYANIMHGSEARKYVRADIKH